MDNFSDIWKASYIGWEYIANIGLPIFLLIISLSSFYWFVRETKKKRLLFKSMAAWFTLNIIYTVIVVYILIVTSLQIAGFERAINIFDWMAHYVFGFSMEGGKEWVFILIFIFISYTLVKSLRNTLKIANLQRELDVLNKRVSVLTGKVNKTTGNTTKNQAKTTKKAANKKTK